MPTVPTTRNAIIALIQEHGSMTAADIAEHLGWTRQRVNGAITQARIDHGTWFFRIAGYRRQRGRGGREAPVYGLGPGKDVARPVMNSIEENRKRQARYRERNRAVINLRNTARRSSQINPFYQLIARTNERPRTQPL